MLNRDYTEQTPEAAVKAAMADQRVGDTGLSRSVKPAAVERDKGFIEIATDHVNKLIHMTNTTTATLGAHADRVLGPRPENDDATGVGNLPTGDIYGLISQLELLEARIRETHEQAERFTSL